MHPRAESAPEDGCLDGNVRSGAGLPCAEGDSTGSLWLGIQLVSERRAQSTRGPQGRDSTGVFRADDLNVGNGTRTGHSDPVLEWEAFPQRSQYVRRLALGPLG